MQRSLLLALAALLALPVFAFDPAPRRGDRIGILHSVYDREEGNTYAASLVRSYLRRELEKRGFETFDVRGSVDDLVRDGGSDADFYVELTGEGESSPYGGVGVGDRHVGVDIAVVGSRVAATVNLFDGRTLEQLDSFDLQRRNTTVMPTSIGLGGRHVGLWIAVPFVQWGRYRSAARAVAVDAAESIIETARRTPGGLYGE